VNVVKIPNFISLKEATILTDWVLANQNEDFFRYADMGGIRKTTRFSTDKHFDYPKESLEIRKQIISKFNLEENEKKNLYPPFKNGIVASCAYDTDTCYEHVDPEWHEGLDTLHCNIITQSPDEGGEVIVGGQKHHMVERELFCYRVSKIEHEVLKINTKKPRVMWVFGFCISEERWKQIIDFNKNE
jgi:hypothetical protein